MPLVLSVVRSVRDADGLTIAIAAASKIGMATAVSLESSPPRTPRTAGSAAHPLAIWTATSSLPSVSHSSRVTGTSGFLALCCLTASFAALRGATAHVASTPVKAPKTPILISPDGTSTGGASTGGLAGGGEWGAAGG